MAEAPTKPAYGSPCNNCGLCCQHVLCPLAQIVFGAVRGPCPAHEDGTEDRGCGLVRNPQVYRPTRTKLRGRVAMSQAARTLIGSGIGCDAHETGEPKDPAFEGRMRVAADRVRRDARRAKITWGIAE